MVKEQLKKLIEKAVGHDVPSFSVEVPADKTHGDYATNVALALSKKLGKNPREVAEEIIGKIGYPDFLQKVEIAGPGFINFYLSRDFVVQNVEKILKEKQFGANKNLKGKKVVVEYTDSNILKEFHIGHLMSNSIGEAVSRVVEWQGAKLVRACYQSDVGISIAKAVWGKIQKPELGWQEAYVFGTAQFEAQEIAKQEITALNKKIFERSDKAVNKLYDAGKTWSLQYFEIIYKKLGTKFNYYFLESQVAGFGKKMVEEGLKKGIFEAGEKGAIVFKGEKVGLHTRVFINSEGLPTYEAKELGLAKIKYDAFKYDTSVIITGNEVNEYFKVLMAAMAEIFPDLQKKTVHIGHGMMRLPEGKMSSRTGNVITFEALFDEVKNMVAEKMADREFSEKERQQIVDQVAVGALKYSIVKQSIGSNIVYDATKAVSFEGDSGPYLQYAHARAVSIIKKAKAERIKPSTKNIPQESTELERLMLHFPEVIEKAGREYQPHYIVTYITELAREFNNYYAHHKIVDAEDEYSPYKVALTQAFSVIMKNGLWLLGIEAPEKM